MAFYDSPQSALDNSIDTMGAVRQHAQVIWQAIASLNMSYKKKLLAPAGLSVSVNFL
ncbi:hypothetical protein PSEUDO8Z_160341 [Pseudomonas sp. 8Z]|nr:hypothetical protein PSEUDO8Z_160341 [Pseudomonas sp. 8Z]